MGAENPPSCVGEPISAAAQQTLVAHQATQAGRRPQTVALANEHEVCVFADWASLAAGRCCVLESLSQQHCNQEIVILLPEIEQSEVRIAPQSEGRREG
jgi:hypothetical protein